MTLLPWALSTTDNVRNPLLRTPVVKLTDFLRSIWWVEGTNVLVMEKNRSPQVLKVVCGFLSRLSAAQRRQAKNTEVTGLPECGFHRALPSISEFVGKQWWSKTRLTTVLTITSRRRILIPIQCLCTWPHCSPSIDILWIPCVPLWRKLQLAEYQSLAHPFHFFWCLIASKQRKLIICFYQEGYLVCRNQSLWNELDLRRGFHLRSVGFGGIQWMFKAPSVKATKPVFWLGIYWTCEIFKWMCLLSVPGYFPGRKEISSELCLWGSQLPQSSGPFLPACKTFQSSKIFSQHQWKPLMNQICPYFLSFLPVWLRSG